MANALRSGGIIGVATDTLKVFDDAAIASRPSFTTEEFPPGIPSSISEMRIQPFQPIWWRDDGEHHLVPDESRGVEALQPHRHLVRVKTYMRSN